MDERYDPQAIEAKWQRVWEDERAFAVPNPEPGEAHGQEDLRRRDAALPLGRAAHGARAQLHDRRRHLPPAPPARLRGAAADGLRRVRPARRERRHPEASTPRRRPSATSRRSASRCGAWAGRSTGTRELSTHDPDFYRWTQWLFLRFYEQGLAYRKEAPRQLVPEGPDRARQRAGDRRALRALRDARSRRKNLTQWFFRITDYADELLDEMALLEQWPDRVLTMQRNWIGRSEGARVVFRVDGSGEELPVFTTRPDTLFGATFFVLAPEHPLLEQLTDSTRGARVRPSHARRARRPSASRRRRTASSPAATRSTPSTARRSRSGSPTTC